ncbi:MAG: gamma-glutamylcyclotransferase [Gammaproteobacteria bacterium]|nr:gamma-glutamylcyclotransferase [Gammaproteobacteria bacterium]
MSAEDVAVFFYGLFMDASLLASKGINPSGATVGYVDGYGLRIGRRATLVPDEADRAYGVLMTIRAEDLSALYSEESVADYVPESVSVVLPDGRLEPAVCYNLPENKLEGTNPQYANSLLALAGKLGLPDTYLRQIKKQVA